MKTIISSILAIVVWAIAISGASAATITLRSMHFSASHMVPHIHYEGPVEPGDVAELKRVYETYVKCRDVCAAGDGRPNAVLTLRSPGGDYAQGLALIEYLRENHIATWVQAGDYCYSACAFAFLGGTGYSSSEWIGAYVDRVAEPGSVVGFHAPYLPEDALAQIAESMGTGYLWDSSRSSLALMVEKLVQMNVDPTIIAIMVSMGPDQTYDIATAEDYYLTRSALPPISLGYWIDTPQLAIRYACQYLLAQLNAGYPAFAGFSMATEFTPDIAIDEAGEKLSGFKISDKPLPLGHCSVTNGSFKTDGEYNVALYLTPGIEGTSAPILTLFNQHGGWSTAGLGGSSTRRVQQKGSLSHYFIAPTVALADLSSRAGPAIDALRFVPETNLALPSVGSDLDIIYEDEHNRIARVGDIWVSVQLGSLDLYATADRALRGKGVNLASDAEGGGAFVRTGTYAASGQSFTWIGLKSEDASAIVRIEYDDAEMSAIVKTMIGRLQCAANLNGVHLNCN